VKLKHLAMLASALIAAAGALSAAHAENGDTVILQPVPIADVHVDDPFWSPKFDVWRRVTIPDCLDKFERDGTLDNFDHVARGELTARHCGQPWFDGLLYEMIRACADFMAEQPDAARKARLDGYIDRITAAAVRDPDGFLNTYTQLVEPTHRWGGNGGNDRFQHDLYNNGCLIDAAVHDYRATGDTKLLITAVRAANGMCKVMGPPPRRNIIPGHAIPEEAMVRLYQLFKTEPQLKQAMGGGVPVNEDDYLALAKFWIDARGHHEGRSDFGAYDQDAVPALQQQTIEGHAVRAALFASGMVAYGSASGDRRYVDAAQRLWQNMVGRRMYITGGIGSFADDEKFGPDCVLPNNGYLETCAAVASCFFSENLALVHGDAGAIDELERSLYNNALAGVSLAGNSYFYENPLQADPRRQRWSWHACPCCPPMFLKLMGALPGYIYATEPNTGAGLYVNLFIGSTAKVTLDNTDVAITEATRYPWSGDVRLSIAPAQPASFDLYIRIPAWTRGGPSSGGLYSAPATAAADSVTLSINNTPVFAPEIVRGYAKLHRQWRAGDTVEIHMVMPVQRVVANEQVTADRGRVAVMRGPLVYCLESRDNPGGRLGGLFLPDDSAITTQDRPDLLGGIVTLHATARRIQPDHTDASADLLAIPYFANANRGPVEMETWIARTADAADVQARAEP
jgi:DUF1680 family protein